MKFNNIYLRPAFLILLMMLVMTGCAGKQETETSLYIPGRPDMDDSLSSSEIAALESTGQIDKNIPDEAMNRIEREYKYYLRKGRDKMCAINKRSGRYMAYAKKVFQEQGMPEELANLAIVESGYHPTVVSHAGAAGAWQFMPKTGVNYGLNQDLWQDERLDPYKATEAAAQYLKKLYADFGDWPTAIAAYNAGEGKMQRAKDQAGARDFYEILARNDNLDEKYKLKDETCNYVPRFLAVSKIMRNLPKLGFQPVAENEEDTVVRFAARPGTDLKDMAKACNLDWGDFITYNRHHKKTITCTDKITNVYVPVKARDLASRYLSREDNVNYAGWKMERVAAKNDSLEKISKRINVPLARLQAANPGLGKLDPGALILSPVQIGGPVKLAARAAEKLDTIKPAISSHVIQPNDTLYSIAKRYNLDVKLLMAFNDIDDPASLRKGQILRIPGDGAVQGNSSGRIGKKNSTSYVVQNNDNLWKIARKHNISVEDLKRWNRIDERNLKPGTAIIVSQ